MRKIIYIIVLAFVFGIGSPAASELINTKPDISAQSKPRKKSKGRKTVKVKSYKKKNGTRVKSYKRKAPKKKRK